ncbi:EF-P 5-aminopentanol modification-associated protein YfmH [Nosocomiicoccus massiliensis]|uniref:Pitrilysin family protein n=1 Tax=Nosocomiicoccus massiliensis TaxID=1232430 RepID=A0AAF1BNK4_9STAP|nr:pitrilysin family protein [Nosocomiicoccus massiliensis]WOS96320.1 pitrilysin family protein [Nosocomiicoccus massiliensis]
MTVKYYEALEETVISKTLPNGLEVIYVKKPGFNKKFATYTTRFGSVDNHFTVDGVTHKIPDGIAHFLEHKMFEKEDGDVFHKFSEHGASANAFTSFDRTSYLFSCTDNFYDNLKLLMDMVEKPYFTDQSVEKEVGIINEEIKMYQDNPGYKLFSTMMESLYNTHPVRIDIAGTLESIQQITKEDLYLCHETFYAPNNMVLIVVGDLDDAELFSFIETHQSKRNHDPKELTLHTVTEENHVHDKEKTIKMNVSDDRVMLGYKYNHDLDDASLLKLDFTMMFALEMVFGAKSQYFYDLIDENLVDDSFQYGFQGESDFSHTLFIAHSEKPEETIQRIQAIIDEVKNTDYFTEEMLQSEKRETIGDYLSSLNSPEYIANQYTKYLLDGGNLYDIPNIVDSITVDDVKDAFNTVLKDGYASVVMMKNA